MAVVAVVGGLTAIFAASMGLAQRDVKKVLAYSTISQLGFMFLAAGVGAYGVAMFHVFTHAFFKACLFLGSGSLIHACHTNDIFEMGGLKKVMKTTHWTFLFSTLAIAGIPIWAGFFSKDAILASVFAFGAGHSWAYALYALAVVTAFMTSFYMFRLYYIVFHGEYRGHGTPHESPKSMTIPLMVLGGLSAVVGLLGIPAVFHVPNVMEKFLEPLTPEVEGLFGRVNELGAGMEITLMLLSVAIAGAGWMLARSLYCKDKEWTRVKAFTAAFPRLYKTVFNKYYVDEIYAGTFVAAYKKVCAFCDKFVDSILIEGTLDLTAFAVQLIGNILRFLHTGSLRNYALHIVLGVVVLLWIVF